MSATYPVASMPFGNAVQRYDFFLNDENIHALFFFSFLFSLRFCYFKLDSAFSYQKICYFCILNTCDACASYSLLFLVNL
jgi:hypothetical protein